MPPKPLGITIVDSLEVADEHKGHTRLWMKGSGRFREHSEQLPVIALVVERDGKITISDEDKKILSASSGSETTIYINAHGASAGGGATHFGANTSIKVGSRTNSHEQFRVISADKVVTALSIYMKKIKHLDCQMLCCQAAAATNFLDGKNLQMRFLESAQKHWEQEVLSVTAHKPVVYFNPLVASLGITSQTIDAGVTLGDSKTGVQPGTSTIAYLHGGKKIKLDLHAQSCPQAIKNFTDHMRGKLYKVQDKKTRGQLQAELEKPHRTVIELADALYQIAQDSSAKQIMAYAKELALTKGREQQQSIFHKVKKFLHLSRDPTQSQCHKSYLEKMYAETDFLQERKHWVDEELQIRNGLTGTIGNILHRTTGLGINSQITELLKCYKEKLIEIEKTGGKDISKNLLSLDAKLLQELQKIERDNKMVRDLTMQLELDELPDNDREKFLQKLAEGAPELVTNNTANSHGSPEGPSAKPPLPTHRS